MKSPKLIWRLVQSAPIAIILAVMPLNAFTAQAIAQVIIGEVAWAGSSLSIADEWLELWNISSQDVPLSGFSLLGAASNPLVLPDNAIIRAGKTFLIANYAENDPKSALNIRPDLVNSALSLSNSSLQIILLDNTGAQISAVGNGAMPPAGSNANPKASMVFISDIWITAMTSIGFDAGVLDLGTPGLCDGCALEKDNQPADENPPDEAEPKADFQESEVAPDAINPRQDFPILKVSLPIALTSPLSVASDTQPAIEIGDQSDGAPLNSSSTDSNAFSTKPALTPLETPQNIGSETTPVIAQVISNAVVNKTPLYDTEENAAASAITAEQITNMTTTTPLTTNASPNIAAETNIIMQTASAPVETPAYQSIKLNEIMPYPVAGKEWIEITALDLSKDIPLAGLQIKDRTGTIFTFETGALNAENPFYVVELASAKLNNDGDTVTLYDPNGNLLDGLDYDKSQKGLSWSRYPNGIGSWQTGTATKNLTNVGVAMPDLTPIIESPATEAVATTTPVSVQEATAKEPGNSKTASVSSTNSVSNTQNKSEVKSVSPTSPSPTPNKTSSAEIAKVSLKSNAVPQAAKTASTAKTTSKKTNASTMTTSNNTSDIRLVLQGTVGSPPGLLPTHRFVLLSPDGRGLLISVPKTQRLPALNQFIELSGTLNFSDDGVPFVKLGSKDRWRDLTATTTQDMALRKVNFIAPSEEDAWSLVEITGTVRKVSGKVVTLDYEGADVEVEINPETNYRVSRLAVGDSVKIIGLLDLSKTLPRIIPRQSDDISLLKHAPPKEDGATGPLIPNWIPLGAAGVAIAGTEGFKQLRERRKRRSLEKILQEDINTV